MAGNYAIFRGIENRDLGSFFQVFCTFSGNLSLFIETDGLFEKKRRVVRSISRDIFQILSDEIFISSEKIGKSSRIRAKLIGRMILNSRRVYCFLPSLLEIPS